MKEVQFSVAINADKEKVWDTLWRDETFRDWASVIDPETYMVGELKEGGEVQFISAHGEYGVTSLVEKLNLTDFNVQQDGKSATYFQTPKNLQTTFRFENKGGAQVAPFGKITVKQGDKVVYETDFNTQNPRDNILPDSARRWEVPLDKIGDFGNYTVTATLSYGTKNQTIEASKSFWVIPSYVIIAAIVGIIVLILLIVGIWWFLRSYKKRVIQNHGRGGGNRR